MRCDDRTQMRDAVVHGITMNRNGELAQQATKLGELPTPALLPD
jgi:hypothetical protein